MNPQVLLEGGSKNRPFRRALGPAVRVISTFPDIVQLRFSPLTNFDKLWLFSVTLVLVVRCIKQTGARWKTDHVSSFVELIILGHTEEWDANWSAA